MSDSAALNQLITRLSPEQRAVVESWGRGMAIMAGAGSGKTTTLVAKCLRLLQRNPEARFAAVSFTERSTSDLRSKLSEALAPPDPSSARARDGGPLAGHWVTTIHGLCATILREHPREAGYDGEESMLSPSEAELLWERAIEALWFDELRPELQDALGRLLARESLEGLKALLRRARDLESFGALGRLAETDPDAMALRELARFVLDRYERRKRRRGALDFNDLERGADRALEHEHVRLAYRERFDLVLVDEFQDTNPLQAGILRRFCREDASNLCVVGDPKQSIYRFRDADVGVFEELCARLPERHSLTWNFRSRPGVLRYANELCAPLFAASVSEATRVPYEPLIPQRGDGDGTPVLRLELGTPEDLAAWIKAEAARGIPLDRMALLLRRIRGNERWLKALTSAGIPIAVGSGGFFWDDPRVRELVAALRWWAFPGSSLSGAVFLRSPWVGVPDAVLDRWLGEDPTLLGPFLASDHPVARRLAPLRDRLARPGELLLALLGPAPEDSSALPSLWAELGAPLLGLWHRVEDLSARGLGFHAVVRELALALEEGRRERDVPPPRNHGQLPVLTLHSSKGLEFDHVILVDLGKKARAQPSPWLFWDRMEGAYLAPRGPDGDRPRSHPEDSVWKEREKAKELAESKRLFYVALTRARERLVLACPELPVPDVSPESRKPARPVDPFLTDDWRAWVERGPGVPVESRETLMEERAREPVMEASARPVPEASGSGVRLGKPRLRRARHSVTEWNLLARCPRAYEWTFIRPVAVAEGIAELGLFTGAPVPRAEELEVTREELGSRVHACLERGDYDGLRGLEREVGVERFSAEPVVSWALSADWMAPSRPETAREVWTELAFEVPADGEVLVGSMDRVVRQGSCFTVIDFKVTERPRSVGGMIESYRTQLELYSWALGRLEPEAASGSEGLIVQITPQAIQVVPVPLIPGVGGESAAVRLAGEAARIVAGEPGRAVPGPRCRYCELRSQCPEGLAAVTPV